MTESIKIFLNKAKINAPEEYGCIGVGLGCLVTSLVLGEFLGLLLAIWCIFLSMQNK